MYTILTDSCSDLSPQISGQFKQLVVLPLSYTLHGETSTKSFDDEQTAHSFYDQLRAGERCTTAQVSPGEFLEAYRVAASREEEILCVIFSSALSGTFESANVARQMLLEEYPDAKVEVVDSLCASAGQGLMVYDALLNRDRGMSLQENAAYLRAHIQKYAHWFTVDDLHFLKRGGRCSPSAAFFGTMLNIKPVLHVDSQGRLIARSKVRGRHQALRALAMKFGELGAAPEQMIFISHGDCETDAMVVKNTLVTQFGCKPEHVVLSMIGPVVGSHAGPGTVALFFRGQDRG